MEQLTADMDARIADLEITRTTNIILQQKVCLGAGLASRYSSWHNSCPPQSAPLHVRGGREGGREGGGGWMDTYTS